MTPTPNRFRDATESHSNRGESTHEGFDITEEVMELLRDQHLDADTTLSLREILNKYALKAQGIAKGRDVTRLSLKSKAAKIAELQQRITALETEHEMDKVAIKHFKNDMAQSIATECDRG